MKLKDWLKKNRYKQTEFAQLVGISDPHMSRIINGHDQPGADLVKRISAATKGEVGHNDWVQS